MSYPITIHFTPRATSCDWEFLRSLINQEIPGEVRGKEKAWIEEKLQLLCIETIIPYLAKREQAGCTKLVHQFQLRSSRVQGHSMADLLKRFAFLKSKTVADIIQTYVIDPCVIRQEKKGLILV